MARDIILDFILLKLGFGNRFISIFLLLLADINGVLGF